MRILLTVDPEIPVPPVSYGGIERIADGLARGYQLQGHEVFLLANPDSKCAYIRKLYAWPALHSRGIKNIFRNSIFLYKVVQDVSPHIVHSFSRLMYGYPLFLFSKVPFIQSYQRGISAKSTSLAIKLAGKKLHFTNCAEHMVKSLLHKDKFTTIFNFTDFKLFNPGNAERKYLMFLGRIEDIKGTKEAIQAAIATNHEIIVAGNIQPGHDDYFEKEISPLLSNSLVQYVGPVNDEQKLKYLQQSKALLFPIKWEEPFGIVLVEALACGVAIIGFKRGSVPEVVKSGINGFVVENVDEMIGAIHKIESIQISNIYEDALNRFSREVITKKYLDLFEGILLKN